jgi:hypothetical protein
VKGIFKEILDATQGPHANGVLYAGAVGLLLSNIIPTPADALYFHREKKLKEKWDNKEITPEKYWQKTATAYYVYKPVWWGLVISAMYFTKGDVKDKAKIGLMIVGAGAVLGIVYRNYTKDIQDVRREVLTSMEPKKNITGPNKPVKVGQYRSVLRKGNVLKFVA